MPALNVPVSAQIPSCYASEVVPKGKVDAYEDTESLLSNAVTKSGCNPSLGVHVEASVEFVQLLGLIEAEGPPESSPRRPQGTSLRLERFDCVGRK